jgi:glucokinase
MSSPCVIGLDIGGTKSAVVCGTLQGKILWRSQFATMPGGGFERTFAELTRTIEEALAQRSGSPCALSVSIGGPLDVLRGVIKSPPNLPGWDEIPLKELLAERFSLPVFVEHDGNAGALAEYYFGAGRGVRNLVFLTLGTGFGAGLILDGALYRGTTDSAGEIGHIRAAEDGPPSYGKRGSFEGFTSGGGIARLAEEMFPGLWDEPTTPVLAEALRLGSVEAGEVFARASLYLGRALALLIDLLNPERIILGGLGMRLREIYVDPALRVAQEEALPLAMAACEVVPAALGEAIGDYASLCAALDQGGYWHKEPHQ